MHLNVLCSKCPSSWRHKKKSCRLGTCTGVTGSASGVVGKAGGEGPRVARSDATLHAVAAEVSVIAAGVVEPNL